MTAIRLYRSALLSGDANGIIHGFPERTGGVSVGLRASLNLGVRWGDDRANVDENRRRLASHAGYDPDALVAMRHVHGTAVWSVGDAMGESAEFDGLVCDRPGPVLGAFSADCVPILFADPNARIVGASHAGWRGTIGAAPPQAAAGSSPVPRHSDNDRLNQASRAEVEATRRSATGRSARSGNDGIRDGSPQSIGQNRCGEVLGEGVANHVIRRMVERGAKPDQIRVALGPSIGPCCFEVGPEVVAQFRDALGEIPDLLIDGPHKIHVNLRLALRVMLQREGVRSELIDDQPPCTKCNPDRFFSYRRDGVAGGIHMAFIAMTS